MKSADKYPSSIILQIGKYFNNFVCTNVTLGNLLIFDDDFEPQNHHFQMELEFFPNLTFHQDNILTIWSLVKRS